MKIFKDKDTKYLIIGFLVILSLIGLKIYDDVNNIHDNNVTETKNTIQNEIQEEIQQIESQVVMEGMTK